jgi:hypothetical protein
VVISAAKKYDGLNLKKTNLSVIRNTQNEMGGILLSCVKCSTDRIKQNEADHLKGEYFMRMMIPFDSTNHPYRGTAC